MHHNSAPRRQIVVGQIVQAEKAERAKQFRVAPTRAEAVLWDALRGNRAGGLHIRRQQIIDGFIVDFYCHAAGLVIEVDGSAHADQSEYDAERDRILSGRGLTILRLSNEDVLANLTETLGRIREVARMLIASPRLPEERNRS